MAAGALTRQGSPVLGLIYPGGRTEVTAETRTMYPSGITFLVENVGGQTLTPAGYDAVIQNIVPAARKLARDGAQAIMFMGTSMSFYRGAAFNQELADSMRRATGIPASTMSTAVVEGLKSVGGRRLAVSTAYNEDVNQRLGTFLDESGFCVLVMKGLGIERMGEPANVTSAELQKFAIGVFRNAPTADSLLLSSGGLNTSEAIAPIERTCRVPVVSSSPHALWAGVRMVGLSGAVLEHGTLLSRS
jgi:arylmalonate decarboxylase